MAASCTWYELQTMIGRARGTRAANHCDSGVLRPASSTEIHGSASSCVRRSDFALRRAPSTTVGSLCHTTAHEVTSGGLEESHRDIGLAPDQIGGRVARDEVDAQLGVPSAQAREHPRHDHVSGDLVGGRDPHAPAHRGALQALGFVPEAGELRLDPGRGVAQPQGRFGGHRGPARALEEGHTERRFQRGHAAAHGRLLDAQRLGRGGEAPVAQHRQEHPQVAPGELVRRIREV
jgi:hypothetical protein